MPRVVTAEALAEEAEALRARADASAASPIAILAGNGKASLVGRTLANELKTPLVPVNPLLRPSEIEHILRDSQASHLFCETSRLEVAKEAIAQVGRFAPALVEIHDVPLADDEILIFEGSSSRGSRFDDTAIGSTLIYTSGTTGKPKGCYRTAAQEAARARELIRTYSLTHEDVQLIACPLAHSAPGIFVRAGHAVGSRSIILPRFDAATFRSAWQTHQGSIFFLVPTQYRRLLDRFAPDAPEPWSPPSSTRAALVAGAPLSDELRDSIETWLGPDRLWQFYGSTETGTVSVAPPGSSSVDGVGTLAPDVEVEVRTEAGQQCSSGERGEMFVRSPTVMSGYWPGKTLDDPNGFVSVGDLGFVSEEGSLHLVDRKNDTIISGGVNVYPAEVEAALLALPTVDAAVVVGVDDEDWGQRVVALVASRTECSAAALREALRPRIAAYKIPKHIEFLPLEEMPVGASGKPLRRRGRELLAKRLRE